MRYLDRLSISVTIYRPQDSRVRDRDLTEFRIRLPRLIALVVVLVLCLALWAAIWALLGMLL